MEELIDLDENKKLKKKITDLEAKLAESEESHHKNIVELTKIATEKDRKIEELNQQLAEKDKEIKELKEITSNVIVPRRLTKIEMNKLISQQTLTAIIELEKARGLLFDSPYEFDSDAWCWFEEQLDNQIKQLKEGK